MPAAWVGAAAAAVGAVGTLTASGGSSGGSSSSGGSYGDPSVNLAGGLSTAFGLDQLFGSGSNTVQGSAQAGAAAANPQGQYSQAFEQQLQMMLQGGITGQAQQANGQEMGLLNQLLGTAGIGTNTALLSQVGNIPTSGGATALSNMVNNPTQTISSLQNGGVNTSASLNAVASQNPYALNAGEQFQESQGLDALNRSLAQTGQVGSGNQMVAAEQYGQNFASQAQAQNIAQMESAQSTINNTSSTNQGQQQVLNQTNQNAANNALNLANLSNATQQQSFTNQLATQQLQTQQQQASQTNLSSLLTSLMGINNQTLGAYESELPALLTASEASQSSPSAAGAILSEEFANANNAAGNVASGIGGLSQGINGLANGIGNIIGSTGSSNSGPNGSENTGASSSSTPDDLISSFTG